MKDAVLMAGAAVMVFAACYAESRGHRWATRYLDDFDRQDDPGPYYCS